MAGEHNARNAVAAIAAAAEMGVSIELIRQGLAKVEASDMRLEKLEIAGRTVFNDAYNANPDAMIASLGAFVELAREASRRVIILGEMRELGPDARALHEEVGRHAARALRGEDVLIAVGPHAAALVAAARSAGFAGSSVSSELFSDPFAAEAAALIPSGAVVLLKGSRGARMERSWSRFRRPSRHPQRRACASPSTSPSTSPRASPRHTPRSPRIPADTPADTLADTLADFEALQLLGPMNNFRECSTS
jgi:UDP-N-acetylmuramoyl-tripeptide--D-alanyl-D-alanine ligase